MATVGNLIVNLIARTAVFEKSMSRATRKLSTFQKGASLIGRSLMGAAGGYSIVHALKESVSAFADFESQLANVSTMLDEQSMRYLPMYSDALRKMSINFGESTETLSKGLYDILSASVAAENALYVLSVSARAAKAGLTDTGTAADAITTILNAYSYDASRATEVSDKLFAIVKRGKTTFGELAPNIGKVAALANVAGLSLDELGAAIASVTRVMPTEIAITGIRSVINAFINPTPKAIEAAKSLGLELSVAGLRAEGLSGALEKLKYASAEQIAEIIPNVRGMAAFAAALKQAEANVKDMETMLESAGLTEEAFEKQTNTLNHALEKTNQLFKDLKVSAGELFEDEIKSSLSLLERITLGVEIYGDIKKIQKGEKERGLANVVQLLSKTTEFVPGLNLPPSKVEPIASSVKDKQVVDEEALEAERERIENAYKQKKAYENATEELNKYNAALEEQYNTLGMTDLEAGIYKLEQLSKSLSPDYALRFNKELERTIEITRILTEEIQKQKDLEELDRERERARAETARRVESIIESVMTPLEKYKRDMEEIRDFLERDLITREIFSRKSKQLKEDLLGRATGRQAEELKLRYINPAGLTNISADPQTEILKEAKKSNMHLGRIAQSFN